MRFLRITNGRPWGAHLEEACRALLVEKNEVERDAWKAFLKLQAGLLAAAAFYKQHAARFAFDDRFGLRVVGLGNMYGFALHGLREWVELLLSHPAFTAHVKKPIAWDNRMAVIALWGEMRVPDGDGVRYLQDSELASISILLENWPGLPAGGWTPAAIIEQEAKHIREARKRLVERVGAHDAKLPTK